MADIYMHERLARDVLDYLSDDLDGDMFLLGAQGPDPYYYRIFSNKHDLSRVIGDRLHDTRVQTMLVTMTNYVKTHFNEKLYAYYLGFLTHYALDCHIHPYVYHNVGVYDPEKPSTHAMQGLHLRFERAIDACLILEDTDKAPHKYPLKSGLPAVRIPKSVLNMYETVVFTTLNEPLGGELFRIAYKRMRTVVRHMMTDRLGLKSVFYRLFDMKTTRRDIFFKDLTMRNIKMDVDYLNRDHLPWHHPVTNAPSRKSVDDLYMDGFEQAIKLIRTVKPYIQNGQSVNFDALFENRSFNSGIDCDDPRPMQYFQLFTEKKS